jgi:hypothetical protein
MDEILEMERRLELLRRIEGFLVRLNSMREAHNKGQEMEAMRNYFAPATIRNGNVSGDWVAIDIRNGGGHSVYCFIRMTDGVTKTLGTMKAGDIHKPATFKAPAKHARGNVYEADFGAHCAELYGIKYLR